MREATKHAGQKCVDITASTKERMKKAHTKKADDERVHN